MTQNSLKEFITRGITPDLDPAKRKKIKILNGANFVGLFATIPFVPMFLIMGLYKLALVAAFATILLLRCIYLVYINEIVKSKITVCFCTVAVILVLSLMLGPRSNADLYLYSTLLIPLLIFSLDDGKYLYLSLAYAVIALAVVKISFSLGFYSELEIDPFVFRIVSLSYYVSSLVTFMGLAWVLFYNNETMEASLVSINKEVSDLLDNLRQGVFTIDGQGNILPRFSAHSREILDFDAFENIKLSDVLARSDLQQDKILQVESVISSSINEGFIQFEVNSHILPHKATFGNGRTLNFYWTPIFNKNAEVEKIMVSAIDVSSEMALKKKADEQSRRIAILLVLASNGKGASKQYIESSMDYLKKINESLGAGQISQETCIVMLRSLHTIKGNSRIYDFTDITDLCHEGEESIKAYFATPNDAEIKNQFTDQLQRIAEKLDEIAQIFKLVFSNDDHEKTNYLFEKIIKDLNSASKETDIVAISQNLIKQYEEIHAKGLDDIIKNQINDAKKICKELGLEVPSIDFSTNSLRIRRKFHGKIQDIFTHILRNSVDHGLRENTGSKGKISISTKLQNGWLICSVKDNGGGLNISKIALKAKASGIESSQLAPEAIAEFIFLPNLSTKDIVTAISGRGIGMDFVKETTLALGGQVGIELLSANPEQNGRYPFKLNLMFPESFIM